MAVRVKTGCTGLRSRRAAVAVARHYGNLINGEKKMAGFGNAARLRPTKEERGK